MTKRRICELTNDVRSGVLYVDDATGVIYVGDTPVNSGGGAPGGSNTNLQVNDGGALNGFDVLAYDKTTNSFIIGDTFTNWGGAGQFAFIGDDANFLSLQVAVYAEGFITAGVAAQEYTAIWSEAESAGSSAGVTAVANRSIALDSAGGNTLVAYVASLRALGVAQTIKGTGLALNVATPGSGYQTLYGIDIGHFQGATTESVALHIQDQGSGSTDYAIKVDGGKVKLDSIAVLLPNLPTIDPHVVGQLWRDTVTGNLKVSAG